MVHSGTNPSGHIERRGDTWRMVVEAGHDPATGQRRRIVRSNLSYHEARRELRRILTDLEEQTYIEPSKASVAGYSVDWLQGHAMVAAETEFARQGS